MLKFFSPGCLSHRRHYFVLCTRARSTNWQWISKKQELKSRNLIFLQSSGLCPQMNKQCFIQLNQSCVSFLSCILSPAVTKTEYCVQIWFTYADTHVHLYACNIFEIPHICHPTWVMICSSRPSMSTAGSFTEIFHDENSNHGTLMMWSADIKGSVDVSYIQTKRRIKLIKIKSGYSYISEHISMAFSGGAGG